MKTAIGQQIEFSSVLFDTLFGLILFFSIDSFLDIKDPLHFIFYLFSLIVLIHRRLIFKSCDDAFDKEVTDSGLDIIIGIIELILIEYVVLMARGFDTVSTAYFLLALLGVDLIWTIIWLYVGKRRHEDKERIKSMERELQNNLKLVIAGIIMFTILIAFAQFLSPLLFIIGFIVLYSVFIVLSFRNKIVDIKIF